MAVLRVARMVDWSEWQLVPSQAGKSAYRRVAKLVDSSVAEKVGPRVAHWEGLLAASSADKMAAEWAEMSVLRKVGSKAAQTAHLRVDR